MDVAVTRDVISWIGAEARAAFPRECCGILLGEGKRVIAIKPAKNVHATPETHFEIDPQALIDAHRTARQGGPQVLGYYHSHPTGDPWPSAIDQEMAARDGSIWAIVGLEDVGFWRDEPHSFVALSYDII